MLLFRAFAEGPEVTVDELVVTRGDQPYRKHSGNADTIKTYTFKAKKAVQCELGV
jgi:hypothetical protein